MKFSVIFYALVLFGLLSTNAYAYLDPGTGSILFQGLVAALATGLATARFWWHRFTGVFSSRDHSESDELTAEKDNSE
ncbi:MAG: hypothetical protein KTR18_10495 [Acidiferrobacterales bacterium]|nr:hypothetical protein [Acidiferrobacterales bacterium]